MAAVELFGELITRPPVVRNQVFVTRTFGVPSRVVDAVCSGITLMRDLSLADIKVKDLRNWGMNEDPSQPYMSLNWYQSRAGLRTDRGFGPQINASQMIYLSLNEHWQEAAPHLEAMIVDRDANMESNGALINFCFAVTLPRFGFVLSTARFSPLPESLLYPVIRRTAAHEFGHVLGLVERGFNFEDSLGRHCNGEKGPCLMRQGLSLAVWLRQHQEEVEARQQLCPDCVNELQARTRPNRLNP